MTTKGSIKTAFSEAHLQREPHHLSPKSAANKGFLADPDIDGAQPRRHISPIMCLFFGRINYLHHADWLVPDFRYDQLALIRIGCQLLSPVPRHVVAACLDYVRLRIPIM